MSKYWNPQGEIVRIGAARERSGGGVVLAVIAGAVVVGLGAGGLLGWSGRPSNAGPSPKIEWNAVQKVPTRTLDAEDVAWERRAGELDGTAARNDAVQVDGEDVGEAMVGAGVARDYGGGRRSWC